MRPLAEVINELWRNHKYKESNMPPIVNKQMARPRINSVVAPPVVQQDEGESVWGQLSGIHMLLYGQSGTGKTTLAATFPEPLLWLICSGGARPGELKSVDTPENRKRITPRIVRETGGVAGFSRLIADAQNFNTVVLDHASGLADLVLREILGLAELPVQKSWGLATQQQYGQQAMRCKEMFRDLLNLASNVVIIAQERTFGDETTSDIIRPTVGAALSPSLAGWLAPACDYVVQAFKRQRTETVETKIGNQTVQQTRRLRGVDYCLRTESHEVYQTKFRVPKDRPLPDCIVDPSYLKIKAVIDGE